MSILAYICHGLHYVRHFTLDEISWRSLKCNTSHSYQDNRILGSGNINIKLNPQSQAVLQIREQIPYTKDAEIPGLFALPQCICMVWSRFISRALQPVCYEGDLEHPPSPGYSQGI